MERRDFIRKAGLLGAIGLSGCAKTFRYTNAKPTRSEGKDGFLARVDELKESTSTLVYTKTGPVLLVKWQGEVKAFESVCPHTMCEVNDGEGEQPLVGGEVRCWIHDSYFKPGDGGYISGPANPSGRLPEFKIRIEDGKIFRA